MSRNKTLNFAIIGCGRIAPKHAEAIKKSRNGNLVAVADILPSRAEKLANQYGIDAYSDYRFILDRTDVDIVSICTPSGLHASIGIDACNAGKHVLIEKPIALSMTDANNLTRTANLANVKLSVVLQNRYNPPIQEMYHILKSGQIGKHLLGNATLRWYRPQSYYEDGWHGTRSMDGGALMNQSIHCIDILQWLMGDVESVFSYTSTLAHSMESEDVGVGVLRFSNGALGIIEGSTITYPQNLEASVSIFGENGCVKVGGIALNRKEIWNINRKPAIYPKKPNTPHLDSSNIYGYGHQFVIEDILNSIIEDRLPKTNGLEAKKSLAIVLALYKSSYEGEEIMLKNFIE
ncbi:MAG: gfo/Idh/MocA family oxidoreductase [Bacteroidetes bacterium]|nr:MAG: gfo/Idh/MocA family oxidoreductase [Bacteroidota bacterium]